MNPTSGTPDQPSGPMGRRISAAQRGDNSGRIPMPLAPSAPTRTPKSGKPGKSGYRKVKKVAPRPLKGQPETKGRSPLIFVLVALIVMALIALAVVRSGGEPAPNDAVVTALSGQHFAATAAFGIDLPEGSALGIEFWAQTGDGGTLAVSGGCNAIGGGYRIQSGSIGTGDYFAGVLVAADSGWSMTEMACDDPLMALDAAVVDLLSGTPRITLVESTLSITGVMRTITFELDGPSSRAPGGGSRRAARRSRAAPRRRAAP
ncbi:MAG: META domain-containing protein, partial [Ilumatobacteraceae bacterium]